MAQRTGGALAYSWVDCEICWRWAEGRAEYWSEDLPWTARMNQVVDESNSISSHLTLVVVLSKCDCSCISFGLSILVTRRGRYSQNIVNVHIFILDDAQNVGHQIIDLSSCPAQVPCQRPHGEPIDH